MKKDLTLSKMRSKDVAQILDCSPDDVIIFAQRNILKGIHVGRYWRFNIDDVNEFLPFYLEAKKHGGRLLEHLSYEFQRAARGKSKRSSK